MSAILPDTTLPGDAGAAIDARARFEAKQMAVIEAVSAVEKLERSRARLRRAMSPPPVERHSVPTGPGWWEHFKQLPVVVVVRDALRGWWSHHPLRPVAQIGLEASNAAAKPIARDKPLLLLAAAAVVGAVVSRFLPWRWLVRSLLFAGLAPQLAARAAAKLPIESWLSVLGSAMAAPGAAHRTQPAPSVRMPSPAA
jgi:hypothetical protein